MSTPDAEPAPLIPDEKTPRLYGTLNIVFGTLLLLCCDVTPGTFFALSPVFRQAMVRFQKTIQDDIDARFDQRLQSLEAALASASTDAEKAEARDRISEFQAQPRPEIPSLATVFDAVTEPRVLRFTFAQVGSGLILDLMMIVTGVGLVRLRPWARRGASAVALLKLARIAVLSVLMILIIAPIQAGVMVPVLQKIQVQAQVAPGRVVIGAGKGRVAPPALMVMTEQGMIAQTTATTIVMAIGSAVYPLILLLMLSKPRVRAAFPSGKAGRAEELG